MIPQRRFPVWLAVNLLIAIVLDTSIQLFWKTGATRLPDDLSFWDAIVAFLHEPLFIGVGVLLVCQMINWLKVLNYADLSFAQPITSLGNVSVYILSIMLLGEEINVAQMFGIAFVLAGVWFVSQTDHRAIDRPAR